MKKAQKIEVYSDGSTKNNGQENSIGGWAYIVLEDGLIIKDGYDWVKNTTNQIMELTAALNGCIFVKENYTNPFDSFKIYSDSAYLVNCANQKWYEKWQTNDWTNSKGAPVANKEIWEQLIPFFEDVRFTFIKVKGHNGNEWNEKVDDLAQSIAEEGRR